MLTDIVQYIFFTLGGVAIFSHIRPFGLGLSSAYQKTKSRSRAKYSPARGNAGASSRPHYTGLQPLSGQAILPDIRKRECKADV